MHAFERNEGGRTFASHRFKGATGIANVIFGKATANKIRNAAAQTFPKRVLSLRAVTANQIRATRNFLEQSWDISGIVLEIAIDHDDRSPARSLDPGVKRRTLSGVFFKPQNSNARRAFDFVSASIGRTVINKNDFVIQSPERAAQL